MSITKRKRKNKPVYLAEIFIKGIRYKGKVFNKKSDAFIWHEKKKAELEKSLTGFQNPYKDYTFSEAFQKWQKDRLSLLKQTTQDSYGARFRYFEKSPLVNFKMKEINSYSVDLWLDWLLKNPTTKNKGRSSFKGELKTLCAILSWWRDYIDADFVVPIVKRHRERCFYKPLKPRRPDYYMKEDEIKSWLEELKKSSNPVYYDLAFFMLLTGARVGEASGMMWKEIDFSNNTAKIVRTLSWKQETKKPYLVESTKTSESVRMLMLPQVLVSKLKERKLKGNFSDMVFCNLKGELLKYPAIQTAFNKAFKKLGLSWRSTHILRHSFATQALMATRDLSAVQASLGHTDQKVTQKYAKAISVLESKTGEKLVEFLKIK